MIELPPHRYLCGKIFWQARGTGFRPVEFDTGKMPVPRWHSSARESCHTHRYRRLWHLRPTHSIL